MKLDPDKDFLGVIDVQSTFMPGGELPVEQGHEVVPLINGLLTERFAQSFATQDFHPPGHASFASTHGLAAFSSVELAYGAQTLWPDHAVQGTPGAALHPALAIDRVQLVLRKGFRPGVDSYSAFFENDHRTRTGLHGYLQDRGCRRLFLAGLATDYCVAWSAEDGCRLGYEVFVIEDASRGIGLPHPQGGTTMTASRARLEAMGVRFVASEEV